MRHSLQYHPVLNVTVAAENKPKILQNLIHPLYHLLKLIGWQSWKQQEKDVITMVLQSKPTLEIGLHSVFVQQKTFIVVLFWILFKLRLNNSILLTLFSHHLMKIGIFGQEGTSTTHAYENILIAILQHTLFV